MTGTTLCMGLHPGVIRSLVDFLHKQQQLQKQKEVKNLLDVFSQSTLHDASNPYPQDLAQCIPRKPSHGFPSIWMLMFSSVLLNGCIIVRKIARGVPDIVVVNQHGSVHGSDCPLIQTITQPNHLLISNNVYNFDSQCNTFTFAELDNVRNYVKETQIATNLCDRFYAVDAGEVITDPVLLFKPYSSCQMIASNLLLNSFQQATHDARQMGWLLETSREEFNLNRNEIMLVMPLHWHLDYLTSLLGPEPPTPLMQTATLDDFILTVLREFNGSVLTEPLAEGPSIHKRVYKIEFH
ncbi:hypothetical protein BT96DRAFT_945740 [Gymnopus androsaceus JB14]|uniref:Uncharacterized protein n=1 Tax=Gymnopus androsaceus JB14 TaxID=1447944 RepID=A0A6A4GZP9_9AGAR|nr:hypothetical protein BT96DRAFT_945740 [Gymnopus androsaceus JB14]